MTALKRNTHGLAVMLALLAPMVTAAEVPPPRQGELLNLLTQDCGSCHGLSMRGGLGPALTPPALEGKAPIALREVILNGRPGTPMPPWREFLTVEEADWLVAMLRRGLARDH